MIIEEKVKITPSYLVAYPIFYDDNGNPLKRGNKDIASISRKHNNSVSKQAQKKLEKAINYTVLMSKTKSAYNPVTKSTFKFKISFITLTLSSPQCHDDITIKEQLLQPFIQQLRQKYHVKYYVWKAERQQNGRIHFHIITDQYIHYESLKRTWNKIQDKLQYISNYHNSRLGLAQFPQSKSDYYNVNSTDVHSVKKVRDLGRYLCKYFDKDFSRNKFQVRSSNHFHKSTNIRCTQTVSDGAKTFLKSLNRVGRLWSCSENLSKADGVSESVNRQLSDELYWLRNRKEIEVFQSDYCTIIKASYAQLQAYKLPMCLQLFQDYCQLLFDDLPE
jgi:hypothetical protein